MEKFTTHHSKRGQTKKKFLSLSVFILKGANHDEINVDLAVLPMELVSRSGIPMKVLIDLIHLEAIPFLVTYTENSKECKIRKYKDSCSSRAEYRDV